jgi:Ca2+-binding EF-hand superfamily protein
VTSGSALVEEATDRVVAAEKSIERTALQSMTKAELSEMTQDIDIDGRADMTKAQLVKAIDGNA